MCCLCCCHYKSLNILVVGCHIRYKALARKLFDYSYRLPCVPLSFCPLLSVPRSQSLSCLCGKYGGYPFKVAGPSWFSSLEVHLFEWELCSVSRICFVVIACIAQVLKRSVCMWPSQMIRLYLLSLFTEETCMVKNNHFMDGRNWGENSQRGKCSVANILINW